MRRLQLRPISRPASLRKPGLPRRVRVTVRAYRLETAGLRQQSTAAGGSFPRPSATADIDQGSPTGTADRIWRLGGHLPERPCSPRKLKVQT